MRGRRKRQRRGQAKGWQHWVSRGAAIAAVLLGAFLTGIAGELTREAEKLLGDLFRPQGEILSGQVRVIDADTALLRNSASGVSCPFPR